MTRDTAERDDVETDNSERIRSDAKQEFSRRRWLQLVGAGSAGLVAGCGGDSDGTDTEEPTGSPTADGTDTDTDEDTATPEETETTTGGEFETVVVPADEKETYDLGDGDTLENLLIDVSAENADVHINASGDDWTIRNVGIKGSFDIGDDSVANDPQFTGGEGQVIDATGNGLIENLYVGDGVVNGVDKTAMIVHASHAGHIEFRDSYVAEWSSNGIYAAGFGRINPPGQTDGAGGTIAFRNCYFRDNNVASLRIAADNSLVEDCVFTNTNNVPPLPETHGGQENVVNGQGIYTGYGDPSQHIDITGSHFEITEENTCADGEDFNVCQGAVARSGTHDTYGELTELHFHEDCEVVGETVGDQVVLEDGVGSNPDTSVPDGVPTNAEEGAAGVEGGAGSEDMQPPAAPENLTSTGHTMSTVDLEWDAVDADDLDLYSVYVDGVTDHTVSAGTTSTTVENLLAGTSYEIEVTATDDSFNESEPSNAITVSTEEAADVDEDFEHADIPGTYSVDTDRFTTTTERATSGEYAMAIDDEADDPRIIMRGDMQVRAGNVYELDLYLASEGTNDIGFLFAGQGGTEGWGSFEGYMGFFSTGSNEFRVDRWVDGGFEERPSTSAELPEDEWITARVDYGASDEDAITMTVSDESGEEVGSVTLENTQYDGGEIGWYNYFGDADWYADSWTLVSEDE